MRMQSLYFMYSALVYYADGYGELPRGRGMAGARTL